MERPTQWWSGNQDCLGRTLPAFIVADDTILALAASHVERKLPVSRRERCSGCHPFATLRIWLVGRRDPKLALRMTGRPSLTSAHRKSYLQMPAVQLKPLTSIIIEVRIIQKAESINSGYLQMNYLRPSNGLPRPFSQRERETE